jgi:outer membrane protein insertion porin family
MRNLARAHGPSLIGAALILLVPVAGWAQGSAANFEGQRVAEIRIVESGNVLEQNPAGLPLQPGQTFTSEAERDSLRQLFGTGRYADIVAQAEPEDGGIRLDFEVRRNLFINQVQVVGLHEPPSDAVAASALRLTFGDVFHESDMPDALDRLRRTLEDEGLYQAKLSYQLTPHPVTGQMDIVVNAEQGPRARAGAVTLTNQTPFSDAELRQRLKLKPKTVVTSQTLDRSIVRVRKWMVGRGYLGARASVTRGAYNAQTDELPLQVQVVTGLSVKVELRGASISQRTLRSLLPIYEERAVDEDLLEEGRRNLRDYFQRQGYFDVEVNYTTSPPPDATAAPPVAGSETITFAIERGARRRLVGLAFQGNRYFGDDILRSRVRIQPAAFLSRGRFSSAQLTADVSSIVDLYRANGFRSVKVTSELVDQYRGKAGDLFVRFHVDEGLQTLIAEFKVEGNRTLNDAEIARVVGSSTGQPYSDFNVAGDRDNVLAVYYDEGFPQANFESTVDDLPDAEGSPRVRLTYHIDEGPQVLVARILVDGYEHTHLSVIDREIQLHTGEPLSEGELVETQRRLYDLSIFNRVSIAPQNPNGTDTNKTVGVLVEEAQRYTIAYGGGMEAQRLGPPSSGPVGNAIQFSPRGIFEFTKLNLTGRADSLSFKVRASTLQGRGLLTYTAPNYFGRRSLSLQLSLLADKTRDVLTFTSTRYEGSVQVTDRLSPTSQLLFRYAYRRVLTSNLQVEQEEIPLFSQPTQVSLVGMTWVRDRRDSPADPSQGSFNNASIDLAEKPIGSSTSFLRATVQNSTYTRIGRRLVFARSTRIGIEHPIGGTLGVDIPLPERFFAGGGTSLRGFGLNQAGPRDPVTGFPIGGLAMVIFNQELQFPMRLPFVGNHVGGGLFYDAGNVYSSFRQISLRAAPPAPVFSASQPDVCIVNCGNELNYFSHTVGFEFRYHTPVGPLSIALGYQLNPARFLLPDGTTTVGGAPGLKLSRLPAFQFFVNLGPTF